MIDDAKDQKNGKRNNSSQAFATADWSLMLPVSNPKEPRSQIIDMEIYNDRR